MIRIHITKALKGGTNDFTLTIDESIVEGDFIAVFGNSGAGKTTLLRILAGLENPTSGCIIVNNVEWVNMEGKKWLDVKKRNVGFVTQQSVLFPNMKVKEQLLFAKGNQTDKSLWAHVIETLQIENLLHRYPQKLSGGQQQRVSFARAIIQKPSLLLLDEPFTALDYEMRTQLIELTKTLTQQYAITTLLVSHHPTEILQLAHKVWHIQNGGVIEKNTPKAFFDAK